MSLLLFAAPGCQLIGVLAYKASGGPTIPAQYAPAKTPTVILVENYTNPAALRLEGDAVARHLAQELKTHKVAPVVEPLAVESHRQSQGAAYRRMPVDAIGRGVGAKQIIYVDLQRFDVTQALASEMLGGTAEARVRVVDDAGRVLWPTDSAAGYPVLAKVQPQRVPAGGDRGGAAEFAVRRQLHADLADRIAKLFYNWKADSVDGGAEQFSG